MKLVVTGSIAFDYLMSFPGKFRDSLVVEQLDKIALSFLVEDLEVRRGGCAANISFGLGNLGLRPILVGEDEIVFRAGFRHSSRVPRSHVTRIDLSKPDLGKACARLSFVAVPTHWIVLSEPATSSGPYGVRRSVRALGLVPDDPDGLLRAIRPEGDA